MKQRVIFISLILICLNMSLKAGQGIMFYKAGFPDVAKNILLSDINNDLSLKAENCFYLGNTYFLENNVDSATYYFNEGLKVNPLYAYNRLGLLMLKMKTAKESELNAEIKSIISDKKNKKDIGIYISISYAYLYCGMNSKALEMQMKAKSINSKSPLVYVLYGDIVKDQNMGDACANYETAIFYDPKCIEAYIKYARAYKNASANQAITKLMKLKEIDPSFVLADRELGDVYYGINDFAQASKYYEKYLNSGNKTNVSDLVRYSMALFMNHEFNKSLEVATLGIGKDSKNPALNRLILYNNVDLKHFNVALNAADFLFNKSKDPNISFLDHRYYGQALKETKNYDLAVDEFKKALKLDASRIDLWKDISDIYFEKKDYPNAISSYVTFKNNLGETNGKAIEQSIALGKIYYAYGTDSATTVTVRKTILLRADSIFIDVVNKKPDDYRGNFWRARVNSALDPETTVGLAKSFYELTASFAETKKDVRYNNVLVECYSYLGWYYFVQKDYTTSLSFWNKIIAIDPENQTAKKGILNIQAPKTTGKKK
jgi:tetratricopeptide (TPR) repeat protein